MKTTKPCPICRTTSAMVWNTFTHFNVKCDRCGSFELDDVAERLLTKLTDEQIAKVSGWIRENQNCTINSSKLENLLALRMPSVGEKAERVLRSEEHTSEL